MLRSATAAPPPIPPLAMILASLGAPPRFQTVPLVCPAFAQCDANCYICGLARIVDYLPAYEPFSACTLCLYCMPGQIWPTRYRTATAGRPGLSYEQDSCLGLYGYIILISDSTHSWLGVRSPLPRALSGGVPAPGLSVSGASYRVGYSSQRGSVCFDHYTVTGHYTLDRSLHTGLRT